MTQLSDRDALIWRELLKYGARGVKRVREVWKKEHGYPRMLISWPKENLRATDGTIIKGTVTFAPPTGMSLREAGKTMAKVTQAYALLAFEQRETSIKIILETEYHTNTWTLPIERHGDVDVLGKEKAAKDAECIGALWRPSPTTA